MTKYGPISRKEFYRRRKLQDQFTVWGLIALGLGLAWLL